MNPFEILKREKIEGYTGTKKSKTKDIIKHVEFAFEAYYRIFNTHVLDILFKDVDQHFELSRPFYV